MTACATRGDPDPGLLPPTRPDLLLRGAAAASNAHVGGARAYRLQRRLRELRGGKLGRITLQTVAAFEEEQNSLCDEDHAENP